MIETKLIRIISNGDPSVGIWPDVWEVTGPFSFADQDELNQFKSDLKEVWLYLSDFEVSIETIEEYQAGIDFENNIPDL